MEAMSDLDRPDDTDRKDGHTQFQALATQALDLVMAPGRPQEAPAETTMPYPDIIEALTAAFLADDPDMRRQAVSGVLRSGVSGAEFIQSHAGDMARMLGDLWAENKISFAEVTIGVARMQETVRGLAARNQRQAAATATPEILLLAPEGENHLLGLFVACEAFEDMGCYVHLAIGQSVDEIAALAAKYHYTMIGISISSLRTVKEARAIAHRLRTGMSRNTPLVLGGGLAADASKHSEVLADLDVDHIVCDPAEALRLCGIKIKASQPQVPA